MRLWPKHAATSENRGVCDQEAQAERQASVLGCFFLDIVDEGRVERLAFGEKVGYMSIGMSLEYFSDTELCLCDRYGKMVGKITRNPSGRTWSADYLSLGNNSWVGAGERYHSAANAFAAIASRLNNLWIQDTIIRLEKRAESES